MNCKARRMLAGVIDFYVICLLASIFVGIITLGQFSVTQFSIVIYLVSCFLLLLVKDITFKDASIGKRMLKLKIVRFDGTKVSTVDTIKRNLTILLLPIEIVLVLTKNKRIGDIIAKTSVISKQ